MLSLVRIKSESNWTGVALLISVRVFLSLIDDDDEPQQGGSFLYVAAVLQPGKAGADDISERTRLVFLVLGMLLPWLIGIIFHHH